MIPKIIHWCWFGPNSLTKLSDVCINSWRLNNPEYEIIKWNEENCGELFNIPFFKNAIDNKMWAFASDYARLWALYKYGGIYLDTDMELLRPLDSLINNQCFFGKEDDVHISAGIIGAQKGSRLIKRIMRFYEENRGAYINIPMVLTSIVDCNDKHVVIYDKSYFYPYNPYDINSLPQLTYHSIKKHTVAIHHWEKKWTLSFIQRIKRKLKRRFLK